LQKDLHPATVSAYEAGAAMPLTNVAKEIYRFPIREGRGSEDFSAIYEHLAQNHNGQPTNPPQDYERA
jgi:3-hydroxyisobutyrate dehydrogenase-like beta-hydroxyacid dehydrogenase